MYFEFEHAVSDGFADVEGFLIRRDADSVGVIEIVRYLDPFLAARRKIENFPRDGGWQVLIRAKDRGISAAVGGHHNIIYAAVEWFAVFVRIPTAQLLAGQIELKNGAMLLGAREQERFLFRERQSVMAATRGVIQHRARFAIPFRQRVGDPANVVKVAVDVQRTFGSKNIADDGDFVGAPCRSSQHCANGEADNFICPHSEPFQLARLENLNGPIKFINGKIDIVMSHQPTESKRLLSYVIAEWACSLKYEHLSPAAIQAAKLFWFDSIGCALGGSQQDDAKILLKHYRAMSGGPARGSSATAFVSGFTTNPVDASFFFSSRRRHTRFDCDWSSDVCSSDLSSTHNRQGAVRTPAPDE